MLLCCVNCGSSSVKLSVYKYENNKFNKIKSNHVKNSLDAKKAFNELDIDITTITCIIHRFVNGGQVLRQPTIIDDNVMKQLQHLITLDKLHNQPAVEFIEHCNELISSNNADNNVKQIVTFDTEFFKQLPTHNTLYALPYYKLKTTYDLIRYGFHGFAHHSMLLQYNNINNNNSNNNNRRIITLQLGSGCSSCAIKDNTPYYCSMGFSPLEGLIMSTRSGSIDASLLIYLQRETNKSLDELEYMLYHNSGLLGLSNGNSNDMSKLIASNDSASQNAVNCFIDRVIQYIGSHVAQLNGCDVIIFGGGIGENSAEIRQMICNKLQWLNVCIDHESNNIDKLTQITKINDDNSKVNVYVAPVDEEILMAQGAVKLL